jgi:guanylate kinase
VSEVEFDARLARGEFLEWAEVFGHRYGTPMAPMEEAISAGRDAILEIDVQGAAKVRARAPDAVLIFLRPPFKGELERRLRARGTEDEDSLARRLATVNEELAQAGWFDHLVVNDDLERATDEVAAIIESYRGDRPREVKDPST